MRRRALLQPLTLLLLLADTVRAQTSPTVTPGAVAADARGRATLNVPQHGRYSIRVASASGVALEVVDRMAGAIGRAGTPGRDDGRLDLFLDGGEYLVRTRGDERAAGSAELTVEPFVEESSEPRQLLELKPIVAELDDLERRSYWLALDERRDVILEAAGRALADLRLWRDGQWLVDAAPAAEIVQPLPGRPLRALRLATTLEPGLYRLSAYGGAALAWAEESDDQPLHLRWGIPALPEAGRRARRVSPFGVDRYRLAGSASYVRVAQPEAVPLELAVDRFDPSRPFTADRHRAAITKETVPPVAEIEMAPLAGREHVVTIRGAAGQPYVLQHFARDRWRSIAGSGRYWLSTIHSGDPIDSIDATAILARRRKTSDARWTADIADSAVVLSESAAWKRRFNLMEPASLLIDVRVAGEYTAVIDGSARVRVVPFLIDPPAHIEPPEFRGGRSDWDLERGFHLLEIAPIEQGIVTVTLRRARMLARLQDALGRRLDATPVAPSNRFVDVALDRDHTYRLETGRQPGVRIGIVQRRLPLDPIRPLPVVLRPGEAIELPIRLADPSRIVVESDDSAPLALAIDGASTHDAGTGRHQLRVTNRDDRLRHVSIAAVRLDRLASAPLPPLPQARLDALPDFPVLTADAPRFLDLEREQRATFVVRATEPGLHRLETTGLLATEGVVRTRTITSLSRGAENGVGRNFLLQTFLRAGDYQLTTTPRGKSRGHLGVKLARAPIVDGGTLVAGRTARATLTPARGLAYRFAITEAGEYHLRALGLGGALRGRLEDDEGWPLTAPDAPIDATLELDPGRYRLILLPRERPARVVTTLERIVAPPELHGHGPHPLTRNGRVHHLWREPEEGRPRTPDRWTFALPAAAESTLSLSSDMVGVLRRDGLEVARLEARRTLRRQLDAGAYVLEVRNARRDDRVDYQVALSLRELTVGDQRTVTAPAEVPLSIGADAMVAIESFGGVDVRARLLDDHGHALAGSDDRDHDWNFLIAERLDPGTYRLAIDPIAATQATTTVALRAIEERTQPPLTTPATHRLTLDERALVLPLAVAAETLALVRAAADAPIAIALERATAGGRELLASDRGTRPALSVPLGDPTGLRLRVWSPDRRPAEVELQVAAIEPRRLRERDLGRGARLGAVDVAGLDVTAAVIELDAPGSLRFDEPEGLRVATARDTGARAIDGDLVSAAGARIWIVGDGDRSRLSARRYVLPAVVEPGVFLRVDGARPTVADVGDDPALLLVEVHAATGQPTVHVQDRSRSIAPPAGLPGGWIGRGAAIAVNAAASARVAVIGHHGDGRAPADVRVRRWTFPRSRAEQVEAGTHEGVLSDVEAQLLVLPDGPKRLLVAVGRDTAVALGDGDAIESVHWNDGAPFAEAIVTTATYLRLLHTGDGGEPYRVELVPAAAIDPPRLDRAAPLFEREHDTAGGFRLRVGAGDRGRRLLVRGAATELLWLGDDGSTARGRDVAIGAIGGTAHLTHQPGLVLAWLAGKDDTPPWDRPLEANAIDVATPAVVTLDGRARTLRVADGAPAMLELRGTGPAAIRITRPGAADIVTAAHDRIAVDAWLPAGEAAISIAPLAHELLSGRLRIRTERPTAITEGLGPAVLLGPGDSRTFSFEVVDAGAIGVGVRSADDSVQATLLDLSGEELGRGVVLMHEARAATHLLRLTAPAAGGPVRARPALAGVAAPPTGPPAEVVRRYLGFAGVRLAEGGRR